MLHYVRVFVVTIGGLMPLDEVRCGGGEGAVVGRVVFLAGVNLQVNLQGNKWRLMKKNKLPISPLLYIGMSYAYDEVRCSCLKMSKKCNSGYVLL